MSVSSAVQVASGWPACGLRIAGTDRRLYALALDRLVAWGIDVAVAVVVRHYLLNRGHVLVGALIIAATVLAVGGALVLMLGTSGTTPGKACCRLRVVDVHTRRPIGVRRALLRAMVVEGATVPFGFGLAALALTALGDPDHLRRGWHDRLVSSVVVDLGSPPPVADGTAGPGTVLNLTAMRLVPARRTPSGPDAAGLPPAAPVSGPARVSAAPGARAAWGLAFDTGERVTVQTIVLVGRRPEPRAGEEGARLVCLPSSDVSVSRTHAQVVVAPDGSLVVTDRGSTNGTVLRRRGVPRPLTRGQPATLLDGDLIHLGDRTMTVVRLS